VATTRMTAAQDAIPYSGVVLGLVPRTHDSASSDERWESRTGMRRRPY
jgi:hypothetical protein